MAYQVDPDSGDIVIGGFDQGVGASPYSGLTDMRSVNPSSIYGEASVSFGTSCVTKAPIVTNCTTGSLTTSGGGLLLAPISLLMEWNQYVTFSGLGGASGATIATPYRLVPSNTSGANQQWQLFTVAGSPVTISGSSSTTVTFSTINPTTPKFFAETPVGNFMIDSSGLVWSDNTTTAGGSDPTNPATHSWTWTGNTTDATSHGNGLVYWTTSNSTRVGDYDGWLLIFRDGQIDYCNVNGVNNGSGYSNVGTYVYGWNPATGSTAQVNYLTGTGKTGCPHNAIVGPDGRVYFCDYYNVRKIAQADLVTPTNFVPGTAASFTYTTYNLLPINDIATCLSPLGTNMLIGGALQQAYSWDTFSNLVTSPILLAEAYVKQIVTVNSNAYIFCGNRGNIYVTNGSQAQVFRKIPDHISGVVEPYFQWGDATFNKNRLYFSAQVVTNAGSDVIGYGGVWALDLDTKAIWLSNQLSYGTYAGYASALAFVPSKFVSNSLPSVPAGYGLLIGWAYNDANFRNGIATGIDTTVSAPYSGGQSFITSDMIPVGTSIQPTTSQQIEWKTSVPMTSNESIQLLVGSTLTGSFTSAGTTTGDGTLISDIYPMPVEKQQWALIKAVLISTATTPTYCRLTQIRIVGATVKSGVANAPYGLR